MIGRNGERRSGISAQAARHDDDDDIYSHPYMLISLFDKAWMSSELRAEEYLILGQNEVMMII